MKRKIHIGTSQSTKVSVEEVKRKQKEREDAKKDFFERLKNSVGNNNKQERKVYSGERKLMVSQRCISLMQWQCLKMIKNLQKISQKCEDNT